MPVPSSEILDNNVEFEDLTAQEIVSRIDGKTHIKKLCDKKFSTLLACRTIRDLIYADMCKLDSIFKFSNKYTTTPKLTELYITFITKECNRQRGKATEMVEAWFEIFAW